MSKLKEDNNFLLNIKNNRIVNDIKEIIIILIEGVIVQFFVFIGGKAVAYVSISTSYAFIDSFIEIANNIIYPIFIVTGIIKYCTKVYYEIKKDKYLNKLDYENTIKNNKLIPNDMSSLPGELGEEFLEQENQLGDFDPEVDSI